MTAVDDRGDPRGTGAETWTPRPDPTILTTAQLLRELAALRELLEARLDGMDRATGLLAEDVARAPTIIQTEISHVREVIDEKFTAVEQRFAERDIRFAQQNDANAEALKAALTAARELGELQTRANALANAKTEESVSQQLKSLAEKIDVNTQRIDRGEGTAAGTADTRTEQRLNVSQVIAAIATLAAVLGFVLYAVKRLDWTASGPVQCANTGRGLSRQPEQAGSKPLSDDTPSKRCSNPQCPEPNPQPVTAFYRNRRARDGLANQCKTCSAKHAAAWRKRNPSYLREYHAANRERLLEQQKQHREDHIDEARARQRQHYADNREQIIEYQERYRAELAATVFNHYGWRCACPGCDSTDLCVDHINGDGPQHRTELYGHPTRYYTTTFYLWLIDNGFPEGFQTLCRPCNSSKRAGTHCRMHAVKK